MAAEMRKIPLLCIRMNEASLMCILPFGSSYRVCGVHKCKFIFLQNSI